MQSKLKAFIAFLTITSFMTNGLPAFQWMPDADAQSAASTVSTTVPNYSPASMGLLGMAGSNVASALSQCDSIALLKDPNSKNAASQLMSSLTKKSSDKTKDSSSSTGGSCESLTADSSGNYKFTDCTMTCTAPADLKSVATTDYCTLQSYASSTTASTPQALPTNYIPTSGSNSIEDDQKKVSRYLQFETFQKTTCINQKLDTVTAQVNAYKCKMSALSSAVSTAAGQLQTALNQNNQNFTKMTQFSHQVQDQMTQIDTILGPDPTDPNAGKSTSAQGLLAVQKEMNDQLTSWNTNEATFISSVKQIQTETTANDQTLAANRMGQVEDCMKGNTNLGVAGGMSLTCYKPVTSMAKDSSGNQVANPVTDAAGNVKYSKQPCGALEYVRSQITQAPFRNGLKSASRNDQSQQFGMEFDSMMSSILRDMGANDTATADGSLVGRTTNWSDLAKKYSSNMSALSSETGVNVAAQMQTAANNCYAQGDSWKNQQIRSAASAYNKQKSKIADETTKLNGQLTQGLSDMNKEYGTAMSLLTNGQAVTLDRSSCTNSDPAKMQACYSTIKGRMQDIMDGTGVVGTTTKPIQGGSMIPGFSIACKGINGCVTTYQNVRSQKKAQLAAAGKATEDFVSQGNSLIQNQLQAFASNLGNLQQQVAASFSNVSTALAKMHIPATATPKYMQGEGLQVLPAGKDGGPSGPYQNPKSMAAVLSGMVQPSGLVDFTDDGMADVIKSAQDKEQKDSDTIDADIAAYSTAQSKIAKAKSQCGTEEQKQAAAAAKNVDKVGSVDPQHACDSLETACSASTASPTNFASLTDLTNAAAEAMGGVNSADLASVQAGLKSIISVDQTCNMTRRTCLTSVTSKNYNSTSSPANQGAGSAGSGTNTPATPPKQ